MAAEFGNIISTERQKLEEVIPLSVPYSVCIDPSNVCNFKCCFCAIQSSDERMRFRKQLMDISLFRKIIDDMKMFERPLKVLRLNGQGEPLLNPDFSDMVRYAKKNKVSEKIETITNGSLLCPKLNQELIDSGIDRIRISIESISNEGYEKITGKKIDFQKLIDNIRDLHKRSGDCEIYCKIVDTAVPTDKEKREFIELMEGICDRCFIDRVIPLWSDYDQIKEMMVDSDKGMHGQIIKEVSICPYPFYSCIINPDGDVTVCCADWKRHLVIGNVIGDSIVNIWHGDVLKRFWVDLAKNLKNNYEMCRKCNLPMFDCNDYIDEYSDQILRRLVAPMGKEK